MTIFGRKLVASTTYGIKFPLFGHARFFYPAMSELSNSLIVLPAGNYSTQQAHDVEMSSY